MITYTLSRDDQALAQWMARERQRNKELLGVISRKLSANSDLAIHLMGALAEVAVARYLGVDPDTSIRGGGDDGYDLMVHGRTIDVKMRCRAGLDLVIMPDMRDFRAQVAVLCWPGPTSRDIQLVGCVSRQRFLREARRDILRNPPRLLLPWRELNPISK